MSRGRRPILVISFPAGQHRLRLTFCAAIIGEIGVPFDMKKTKLFGLAKGKESFGDYTEPAKVGHRA